MILNFSHKIATHCLARRLAKLCLVLSLLLAIPSTFALDVGQLYQASVPVASQSAVDREKAFAQAFIQALIKVSGNPNITDIAAIKPQLAEAADYVEEFSYRDNAEQNQVANDSLSLMVQFDPSRVDQLIAASGQAIWRKNRPDVLLWLVVKQQEKLAFIGASGNDRLNDRIRYDAQRRGLPVYLPLYDLTDLQQVSVEDVWLDNVTVIEQASKRYGSNAVVVAHIDALDAHQWHGVWSLALGEAKWRWDSQGDDLEDVITQGIDQMANRLAQRDGAGLEQAAVPSGVTMRVTQIDTIKRYHNVLQYLRNLATVKDVDVVRIDDSELILRIDIQGDVTSFTQSLAMGKKLTPSRNNGIQGDDFYSSSQSNDLTDLTYQWNS